MIRIISILTASLLLIGCTRTKPLVLGPDHPANPEAAEAPAPRLSQTLVTTSASMGTTPVEEQQGHAPAMKHEPGGIQQIKGEVPASTQAAFAYICPMHPEVTSDNPGKCPKCAMPLVKKGVRE